MLTVRWQIALAKKVLALTCAGLVSLVSADEMGAASDPHGFMFEEKYVSAQKCGTCHPGHYKEWAASPHSYAQISPVFSAMNRTLVKRTNGTMGDFCVRCHTPVGMEMGEPALMANLDRSEIAMEGVTCISCHRRAEPLGKVSGRIRIERGDIYAPVYGAFDGDELQRVISSGEYEVNAERGKDGRSIHAAAFKFQHISSSAFCGACHDVNSIGGLRLEEAFSGHKSSPAARKGTTCQDCHMSTKPGVPSGYAMKPVAIVGGKPTKPRKRTNHRFIGPDYSIVHPGIFPHNQSAKEFATMREWVDFDWKAGWGTDDFEFEVDFDHEFPERWEDPGDRYEAREYIEENLELLEEVAAQRKALLQVGYVLTDIDVQRASSSGLAFEVGVASGTDGHGVPTGFDGERLVFLRVTVVDSEAKQVFISGDLDPNGDLRDLHSLYVHDGKVPLDPYLLSLQSPFIVNMARGGDREAVLPVNNSVSPLPFIRPPTTSRVLTGRPAGVRKHRQSIPPGGARMRTYEVSSEQMRGSKGPYKVRVDLIAGMVPVNLVAEIAEVGFPYKMSPREVADAVVAGHQVLWTKETTIAVTESTE